MAKAPWQTLVGYLRRVSADAAAPVSDGALLEHFVTAGDEAAFTELVQRHGTLVWGVCRRQLRCEQDVEDAFQATFLVLVRKASSVRTRSSVRSYLYAVALRTARHARERESLRRQKEAAVRPAKSGEPDAHDPPAEALTMLDQEIARLPEKYRLPILLCGLNGETNEEAARQLGCPKATVATRLSRARQRLRGRLERRGVTLSLTALGTMEQIGQGIGGEVVRATVRGAGQILLAEAAGAASPGAVALMEGVVHAMFWTKCKMTAACLLALAVVGGGAGACAYALRGQNPAPPATPPLAKAPLPMQKKDEQDEKRRAAMAAKMKELLKARLEAAREQVAARKKEFEAGRGTAEDALEAEANLLKAELGLAETKEERIKAYENYLATAKAVCELMKARFDAGRVPITDWKKAEFHRLDVEIELLREQMK